MILTETDALFLISVTHPCLISDGKRERKEYIPQDNSKDICSIITNF